MYLHGNPPVKVYHERRIPGEYVTQRPYTDIDVQKFFFAIVNWPITEFYGAFVCVTRKSVSLLQSSWPKLSWLRGRF